MTLACEEEGCDPLAMSVMATGGGETVTVIEELDE